MDVISNLNLVTAAELAIMAAVVYALTQAIKQTPINNKFLPWVSMAFGIMAGLVSVWVTKDANYGGGALAGLLVGAATSGLFDGFKSFKPAPEATIIQQAIDVPDEPQQVKDDHDGSN